MVFAAMGLYVWKVAVDVEKYTPLLFRTFGMTGVVTAFAALIFLGPFFPHNSGCHARYWIFWTRSRPVGAWLICLTAISLTALLFICVLTGVVEDVGVFKGDEAELAGMLFMALMVPLVLFVTFLQARWSRRVMESAMGSAVSALMDINLKKVQLEEAQAEIDRIFGNDGLNGRHTGAQIEEYRLGPLLGRGASGEVYDAVDQSNGRRAALKLLTSQYAEEAIVIARFKRGAYCESNSLTLCRSSLWFWPGHDRDAVYRDGAFGWRRFSRYPETEGQIVWSRLPQTLAAYLSGFSGRT